MERLTFLIVTANDSLRSIITGILNNLYKEPLITTYPDDYRLHTHGLKDSDFYFIDFDMNVQYSSHSEFKVDKGFKYFLEHRNDFITSGRHFNFITNDSQKYKERVDQFNIERIHLEYFDSERIDEFSYKIKADLKSNFYKGHPFLKRKDFLLFVHGFSGNGNSFNSFKNVIESDQELTGRFKLEKFNYTTFSLKFFFRSFSSASINDLADAMVAKIESHPEYDEYNLVGHSMGCLIIKTLLIKLAKNRSSNASRLTRIKIYKVFLFAGAFKGSYWASISFLLPFKIRHLSDLRINSSVLRDLLYDWKYYGIKSKFKIYCFFALRDLVVRNSRIKDFYVEDELIKLDYSHANIIDVNSIVDDNYRSFKNRLLEV